MATFLFDHIVFGPLSSRRLGQSLGINLLPLESKFCNFNCIYCECGWNSTDMRLKLQFPRAKEVLSQLESKFCLLRSQSKNIDSVTLAGNGEPTLHPNFAEITQGIIELKQKYFPRVRLSVLTNGSKLKVGKVADALMKFDQCIVKLDAGNDRLFRLINQPISKASVSAYVSLFKKFKGKLIVQSLFLKGKYRGEDVSNLATKDVLEWLQQLKLIQPHSVMVYTLDRDTPATKIQKASEVELMIVKKALLKEGFKLH